MPNANVVIPIMESTIGQLSGQPQGIAWGVEFCKHIMRQHDKGSDWWEWIELNGLQEADTELGISLGGETGAIAVGTDITDCIVFGIFVRSTNTAGTTEDTIVGVNMSGGSLAFDATGVDFNANDSLAYGIVHVPDYDGATPSWGCSIYPAGLRMTKTGETLYAFCDGVESTQPTASTVDVYVLLKVLVHD